MSELDPELKRLLGWSRAAPDTLSEAAPFGLAARVASHWRETQAAAEPSWWPRLQRVATWLSLVIVAGGFAIWTVQFNRPANIYDFSPAYQLIAKSIAP